MATDQEMRDWARANGYQVGESGRLPQYVMDAYHRDETIRYWLEVARRNRVRGSQESPGEPIWAAAGDGSGRWAVCRDGRVVRSRWVRLSCIDAQVIAAELQRAYEEGREEGQNGNVRCSNCGDVMVCKCLYCDNDT